MPECVSLAICLSGFVWIITSVFMDGFQNNSAQLFSFNENLCHLKVLFGWIKGKDCRLNELSLYNLLVEFIVSCRVTCGGISVFSPACVFAFCSTVKLFWYTENHMPGFMLKFWLFHQRVKHKIKLSLCYRILFPLELHAKKMVS